MNEVTISLLGFFLGAGGIVSSVFLYFGQRKKTGEETHHIYITASDLVVDNLMDEVKRLNDVTEELRSDLRAANTAHEQCDENYKRVLRVLEQLQETKEQ